MKLVPIDFEKIRYNENFLFFAYGLIDRLKVKYGKCELDTSKLQAVYQFAPLENKVVLDLGCGYKNNLESLETSLFEPWVSRALKEDDVRGIGIDQGDNSTEKFENYQIDLSRKNSLDFLENNSVDIACAFSLFDSPILTNYYYCRGRDLFQKLLSQLERIVKPNGVFIFEELCSGYKDV